MKLKYDEGEEIKREKDEKEEKKKKTSVEDMN